MKKTLLLSVFIFAVMTNLSGQYYTNQNKVWAFGDHAGVNFTSGSPVPITTAINTTEGCASVSSSTGSLLFYTDGKTVFNSAGAVMPSGASIVTYGTVSATQAAAIVPVVSNPNQYYVFSLEQYGGSPGYSHLAYSIVDMSLAGGLGDVVAASMGTPLASGLSEKMTSIAGNGCSVWLLTHRDDSAVFWAFKITGAGIAAPVVSYVGAFAGSGTAAYAIGVIKGSPNGKKIVSQCYTTSERTELFDFNATSGVVSNCQVLDSLSEQYGAEFSPDNTKLYAEQFSATINQYDITLPTTAAIIASRVTVGSGGFWGDLKLAPDNKIYVSDYPVGDLDCITSPNLAGAACGFTFDAVVLAAGTESAIGLPNIVVAGYSLPSPDTINICAGDSILLSLDSLNLSSDTSATYMWSGPNAFSSTVKDTFITAATTLDSGIYKIVVNMSGCADSSIVNVKVHVVPTVNLGPDNTVCSTATPLTLGSASTTVGTYLWNTGATTATIPVTASGTYWLTVSNAGCTKSDTENVTVIDVFAPTATAVRYCQGAVAVPLTATGTGLMWWTVPAGGTGSATAPTPSTATAGVTTYYVSSVSGICESARVPVTVTINAYPDVNLGPDTIACNATSYLVSSSSTVFAGETYLWSTGATTAAISAVAPGTYWLTATNGGCSKSDTVTVSFNNVTPPVATSVTYCQGDVPVPLSATGISLLWWTSLTGGAGSAVAPTPSTVTPGVTMYYVTSTSGTCLSVRVPDTVTVNPTPMAPFVSYTSPYCQGAAFIPMAGTGSTLTWYTTPTGGVGDTTMPTVNTGIPGTYSFFATQFLGTCESPRSLIDITVLDSILPSFNFAVHYGCNGDTVLFNNTTTGAATYFWRFGDGYSDTATDPRHVYAAQGIYTVSLVANNHLCADSTKMTDSLIHRLRAAFVDSPFIYCQDSLVTFTNLSDSVSDGPLTFKWLFSDGATSTSVNTTHIYKNSGVYNVQLIATNFIPCSDTLSLKVYVDSTTALSLSVTDSVICRSSDITFMGNYTGVGNTGVTWNFGDGDSIKNVNPVVHAYGDSGTYTVTVTPHYRACRDTSVSRTFTIYMPPTVNLGSDTAICPGSDAITLSDNINKPPAYWLWSTGQTTPAITVAAPGHYWLQVTLSGCTTTDSVLVSNDCYMDIPNVFTPNGDGMNDYFFPRQYLTKGLVSFNMNIYNRWGQLIFQAATLNGAGWDGKFNGSAQPEGVYVYEIDAVFKDGQKEHHQGNVTLLR